VLLEGELQLPLEKIVFWLVKVWVDEFLVLVLLKGVLKRFCPWGKILYSAGQALMIWLLASGLLQ
jgi:hypothetical protein